MTTKRLIALGIAAVVITIAAVIVDQQSQTATAPSAAAGPTFLLGSVDPAGIARVVVTHRNDTDPGAAEVIDLTADESGHFVIASKHDYPADMSRVNELLIKCLDIRTDTHITDNAANHADLGLTDDAAAYSVTFYDKDGTKLTGVLVSAKTPEGSRNAYVRRIDKDDVYVAAEPINLRTYPFYYATRKLCDIANDDIATVTVAGPDETYTIAHAPTGDLTLSPLPAGATVKAYDLRRCFEAPASLLFQEALPVTDAPADLDYTATYRCMLKDKVQYTFAMAEKDAKTYMTCTADYTDTEPVIKENRKESTEQLEAKAAKLAAYKGVQDYNALHSAWVYEVATWKADLMRKPSADLYDLPDPNAPVHDHHHE